MNIDSLFDTVLKKAKAAGAEAEIFYENSESRPVEFDNNQLKYLATKAERGIGLRVIKDGRIGFSSTSNMATLDELVENALESSAFGERAEFEFPAQCTPAGVAVYDERVCELPSARMVEFGQAAINRLLARHPEIKCTADVSGEMSEERVANTRGLDIGHRCTTHYISLTALSVHGEELIWAGDSISSCRLIDSIDKMVDKIAADLDLAKRPAAISTGTYPAIFTPEAMATLFISIAEGVNGKVIQKGASPLGGRVGEKILNEQISIYDDGVIDWAPSSAPHDTEGLRSRRTPLFERGVLKNCLYDLQTAALMKAEPTGNGLRGYDSSPSPGHNNTVIATGDTPFAQMIKNTKRGILVDNLLGGGMSNTLAGEFSVNLALGFLIENGELVGRVKNCMLFGNVYDLLDDGVLAIGDVAELKGSLMLPPFHFKGISVATHD